MKIRGTRFIWNVVRPHPIVTNLPPTNTCEKEWYLPVSVTVYFDLNLNTDTTLFQEAYQENQKREEERKKAAAVLKTSHANNPTPEQKAYRDQVREWRAKKEESDNEDSSSSDPASKELEPKLSHCTNQYDLKMFLEAQAMASETIVSVLTNLNYEDKIFIMKSSL